MLNSTIVYDIPRILQLHKLSSFDSSRLLISVSLIYDYIKMISLLMHLLLDEFICDFRYLSHIYEGGTVTTMKD